MINVFCRLEERPLEVQGGAWELRTSLVFAMMILAHLKGLDYWEFGSMHGLHLDGTDFQY